MSASVVRGGVIAVKSGKKVRFLIVFRVICCYQSLNYPYFDMLSHAGP